MNNKRQLLTLLMFLTILLGLLLTGCDSSVNKSQVHIKLAGFPSENSSYYIQIYGDNGELNLLKEAEGVKNNQIYETDLDVQTDMDYLIVFLFSSTSSTKPEYLWVFSYDQTSTQYQTIYWLNYHSYVNDEIEFGLSEELVRG